MRGVSLYSHLLPPLEMTRLNVWLHSQPMWPVDDHFNHSSRVPSLRFENDHTAGFIVIRGFDELP